MVGADLLAFFRGQGVAHRHRLHKANDRNEDRRDQQFLPGLVVQRRQTQGGQAAGHIADQCHVFYAEVEGDSGNTGHHHADNRARFTDHGGGKGRQAGFFQQRLQAFAHPE